MPPAEAIPGDNHRFRFPLPLLLGFSDVGRPEAKSTSTSATRWCCLAVGERQPASGGRGGRLFGTIALLKRYCSRGNAAIPGDTVRRRGRTYRGCRQRVCRRVARRMFFTTCAAGSFTGTDFCLIFAPLRGYDEPEILPSSTRPICHEC